MSALSDFHGLRIAGVAREAGDALVVTFDVPASLEGRFRFKPGQFLAVRAQIDGEEVRRSYSICAGVGEPLRIAIKKLEGGRFSSWAHENLYAGGTLDAMAPGGKFVLAAAPVDGSRHVIAIAAGAGITPVLGVVRHALLCAPDMRVTLIYGNRRRETVIFGAEIEALKDAHLGRFAYVPIYSRPGEVETPLFEGRIDGAKIKALNETLVPFGDAAQIFLCGPGSMIKEARDTLQELGIGRERIVHEFFAAGGGAFRKPAAKAVDVATPADTHANVTVILDGVRYPLALANGETVLQAALKAGVNAPYACAGGMCCTCRAKIVEGTAQMAANYSLEPWEIKAGFVLTCQATPTSDGLVIDWDAM